MKRRNEQTIGEVLKTYLKAHGLQRQMAEAEVLDQFALLVGTSKMRYCGEVRFRSGTLCVEVRSAALKNELMMNRKYLMDELNRKAGMDVVERIYLI